MMSLRFDNLKSVLCIGCHADDIEIGCGGTLLRLVRENPGLSVHWVVLGATGERVAEAKRSAAQFLDGAGASEVVVHGFRDTLFPFDAEAIKNTFAELGRRLRPDVVFTHRREDAHQDHRVAAEFTWCTFRDHLILEYEIPKYEGDLGHPNVYVALDDTTAKRKVALTMEGFPTQRDKPWFQAETFTSLMRIRGIECKAASGFAEGFHCRKAVLC